MSNHSRRAALHPIGQFQLDVLRDIEPVSSDLQTKDQTETNNPSLLATGLRLVVV